MNFTSASSVEILSKLRARHSILSLKLSKERTTVQKNGSVGLLDKKKQTITNSKDWADNCLVLNERTSMESDLMQNSKFKGGRWKSNLKKP